MAVPVARPRKTLGRALAYALTALLAGMLWSELYVQHSNTLHQNGHWSSGKVALSRGVMGAVAFLTTRTALFRNRLNLGAWHGYQEVVARQPLGDDLREVSFDFQLTHASYFTFIHHRHDRAWAGLRLSSDPIFPSQTFTSTSDGETVQRDLVWVMPKPGWHRLHAVRSGGMIAFDLDGQHIATSAVPADMTPTIGFRGGMSSVMIDDVEARSASGAVLLREDFGSSRSRLPVAGLMIGAVLLLGLVMRWRRYSLLYGNALLCAGGLVFFVADWFYLSSLHPSIVLDWGGYTSTIEKKPLAVARLRELAAKPAGEGVDRILFVGSSQTWGAGALQAEQGFVPRVCAALPAPASGRSWECVNSAISGEWAPALVSLYLSDWTAFSPRLVVVNLGNNDGDVTAYGEALERLAAYNEAHAIPTLFVLEPNSSEGDLSLLTQKHARMREVAGHHRIPVVDLQLYMTNHRDDGYLWWDFVHPTSFGHRLIAERLAVEMAPFLSPPAAPRR